MGSSAAGKRPSPSRQGASDKRLPRRSRLICQGRELVGLGFRIRYMK